MGNAITKENKEYPSLLKRIGDAPKQLYYKGNWNQEIFMYCLAVVGTRRMTGYGKRTAEELVGEIAASGITIVSGFMYGIDATAHKAALGVGGKTIAVMPCGIDVVHPTDQEDLYKEILKTGGLVVSEYEGIFQPTLWSYPKRNRIVAGLCQATMVVEAGEKSGSLITANLAKKYERKLFAVPGPVTSEVAKGTNQLLKEGAQMVTSAKDVIKFYAETFAFSQGARPPARQVGAHVEPAGEKWGKAQEKAKVRAIKSSSLEQKILEHLRREPAELNTLARKFELSASALGAKLSFMQLEGVINEDGGKYYAN